MTEREHAAANGNCPDYGSTFDPCLPGCASGICVATDAGKRALAERTAQEQHLAELVLEMSRGGWLNYADWLDGEQAKVIHTDVGTMRVVAESGYGDVIGEFEVTVTARKLPPQALPADGQQVEDDGAQQDTLIWVSRTWADVRTGDRVRLGTNEAHVHKAVHRAWRVDPRSSEYRPQPLDWECVYVVLLDRRPIPGQEETHPITPLGEWDMDPTRPVDIQISTAELDAMRLIVAGDEDAMWANRVGLIVAREIPGDRDE